MDSLLDVAGDVILDAPQVFDSLASDEIIELLEKILLLLDKLFSYQFVLVQIVVWLAICFFLFSLVNIVQKR